MNASDLARSFEESYFPALGTESLFEFALSREAKPEKLDAEEFRRLIEGDTRAETRWPVLHSLLVWLVTEELLAGLPDWSQCDGEPFKVPPIYWPSAWRVS